MVSGADGSLSPQELGELVAQSQKQNETEQNETFTEEENNENQATSADSQNSDTASNDSTSPQAETEYLDDFAHSNFDLLLDVTMHVTVEIGRSKMKIEDVLKLGSGSIVELDKLNGELVDIRVNNRLIGQGEVVAVGENFGIKIHNIIEIKKRFTF